MLKATDAFPMNFGFSGKGNASDPGGLKEVLDAGAAGFKLHEDWGTTPAAIDACIEDVKQTLAAQSAKTGLPHTIEAWKSFTDVFDGH